MSEKPKQFVRERFVRTFVVKYIGMEGVNFMKTITSEQIKLFREYLVNEEKAMATIDKYIHDVEEFLRWLANPQFDKGVVLTYKNYLF